MMKDAKAYAAELLSYSEGDVYKACANLFFASKQYPMPDSFVREVFDNLTRSY